MTKKKKRWIIIGAIFSSMFLTVILLLILGFPWTLMYIGYQFEEEPPQPVVSYAEFPFELVYEIDGERIEIKDTLVIEHKGTDWNEGIGKYNVWARYLKSEPSDSYERRKVVLLYKNDDGKKLPAIFLELGSCEYFMGLEEEEGTFHYLDRSKKPGVIVSTTDKCALTDQELYEKYNIKIIKKSLSPPINPEDYSY